MNAVSVIETFIKNGLRHIKVLRLGKEDVQSPVQTAPFGLDSVPVEKLRALYTRTGESGKNAIIGYVNINALESLEPGETSLFSTDDDGARKFEIILRKDGTAEIGGDADFMVRFNALESGFNQLKSDFNGSLVHVHGAAGTPPVPAIPPSTASISGAKIDEIKTSGG